MRENKPLDDYDRKRDFRRTTEPGPEVSPDTPDGPVFVVHRHEARNLHYDLRIEVNGVLASFAVPKGFSYDPTDKHLAVRTEDHPLKYLEFSGRIPKGQYGAGTMTIWDSGRYELVKAPDVPTAFTGGEIKLKLYGRKLRGEWHLVRLKKEERNWLLFKSKDAYAGKARDTVLGIDLGPAEQRAMPRSVKPMQPGAEKSPFSDPGWFLEMEFEGRRVMAEKRGESCRLRGVERGVDRVVAALADLRAENALIDAVLVATDENGRPSAEQLESALAGNPDAPLSLYAVDLLYYDEFDLRRLPLVDRKAGLRAILPESRALLFADHVPGNGEAFAHVARSAGIACALAKRADSAYRSGPSQDWWRIDLEAEIGAAELPVDEALSGAHESLPKRRFSFTNLEKVFWPAEGFTKGDLVVYYETVADILLPYLVDRPIHMNRFPDGIDGKSFYQRRAKEGFPDWVPIYVVESGSKDEPMRQFVCNDVETLLFMIQQGSIDLHPWLSRYQTPDSPDWAVIDLDPKGAPFSDVVKIARETGKLLRGIGLRPLVKTSGSSGIHIHVPLVPAYTYDHSRMFCEGVARVIVREHPGIATVERVIGQREGKVYIDFLQNRRSQTIVPPYSVRPVRGATVSAPLAWDELDSDLSPSLFTIQTMPPRIEELGDLFRPALTDKQDLLPAIEALQEHLRE